MWNHLKHISTILGTPPSQGPHCPTHTPSSLSYTPFLTNVQKLCKITFLSLTNHNLTSFAPLRRKAQLEGVWGESPKPREGAVTSPPSAAGVVRPPSVESHFVGCSRWSLSLLRYYKDACLRDSSEGGSPSALLPGSPRTLSKPERAVRSESKLATSKISLLNKSVVRVLPACFGNKTWK